MHFSQVAGPSSTSTSTSKRTATPPSPPGSKRPTLHLPSANSPSSTTMEPPPSTTPSETPTTHRKRLRRSLSDSQIVKKALINIEMAPSDADSDTIDFLTALAEDDSTPDDLRRLIHSALREDDLQFQTHLDNWSLPNAPATNQNNRTKRHPRAYGAAKVPPSRQASHYKKTQDLFGKNRKMLADCILEGRTLDHTPILPEIDTVDALYRGILESPADNDDEPFTTKGQPLPPFRPITPEEVERAKSGWSNAAPGADGITVPLVKRASNVDLAGLFNCLLYRGMAPSSWRKLRTILIPKEGDLRDPSNWRPISIGSAIQRLLHRILAHRLKQADLNINQRGFVDNDGVLTNCLLLDAFINHKRQTIRPHTIVSLDLRKAFDSVGHDSIRRSLQRMGVDPTTSRYILNDLSNASTTIKVGNNITAPISIKRGVKQGDPLSPILFNLVLDELLDVLENGEISATLNDTRDFKVPAMAFADDLILLFDKESEAQLQLSIVDQFLKRRGMSINPKKCRCISSLARDKKLISRSKPFLTVDQTPIPMVTALSPLRYLGHQYGLSGINKPSLANLPTWLKRIHQAALKPDQKLLLIKDHVIPRLLFAAQSPKITMRALRDADRLNRLWLKRMLHLNIHTPNASIHASVRDGGLGILELKSSIPAILVKRLIKIRENDTDRIGQRLTYMANIESLMTKLSAWAGDIPPQSLWRDEIKAGPLTSGLESASESSASRNWIYSKPHGWSGRDFVKAIQLRTSNLPTQGIPSNPPDLQQCRAGCKKRETICHVLQGCPATHWPRIGRHNEIVKKIRNHCKVKKWTTEEEPHVRHPDGTLYKPDLIVHLSNKVVITDVQVCWEGEIPLGASHDRKRAVYENPKFREAIQNRFPNKTVTIEPITVGARGIWPRCNDKIADLLQLGPNIAASCVHSALKWAATIHGHFGQTVWRRR